MPPKRCRSQGRRIRPRDDSTRKTPTFIGLRVLIDSYLVVAKIENQLECPAWENPLPQNWGFEALINPEIFDEIAQRRGWSIRTKQHGKIPILRNGARSGPLGNVASLKAQDNITKGEPLRRCPQRRHLRSHTLPGE